MDVGPAVCLGIDGVAFGLGDELYNTTLQPNGNGVACGGEEGCLDLFGGKSHRGVWTVRHSGYFGCVLGGLRISKGRRGYSESPL
jgi:hypothetical protein